jgi:Ca-activated chloride channel family protein
MGNYKDSKLEVLAKKGNGNFAYLDDEKEAEKVLVKEFTQTIYSVANNAYLDIDIDPALVKSYRLVGFDNKLKALDESLNEVEGGEVGSGYSLLAMFEIVPATGNESLGNLHPDIGKILLHYKLPGEETNRITSYNAPANEIEFDDLPAFCRFGSSLAMFGGMLKKSRFMKEVSWNDLLEIAQQSRDTSDPVQTEFITLINKAKKIYGREKKHKSSGHE